MFVDETGTNRALTPRYARAPRGQRAHGRAPAQRGENLTLIAALRLAGMEAATTVGGAADGAVCEAFVQAVLGPRLVPGQIVIWDNVRPHPGARLRELIAAAGGEVIFPPPSSPDFNPIEEAFSKVKAALRRAAARTTEALTAAIGAALDTITPADAAGWFGHGGYHPPAQPS